MRDNEPIGGTAAKDAAGGLGPVILEQKPKPLAADILLALALLFLIITALIDFTADFRTGVVAGPLCGGVGVVFAVIGILYIHLTNAGKASYLHERGLRIVDGRGERTLRYQDVAEMTFKAIRHFHNGAYVGTSQEIALRTAEPGAKPLVFRHTYKEKSGLVSGYTEGTPLNRLCNVLTGMIARRMAADLQRGESVPWTRSMQINNRGVEITDKKRGWEEVEWERIARVDVSAGIFRLWVEGETKPRVQLPVAEPNFFPGYAVVAGRLEGSSANPPTQAPPAAAPAIPDVGGSDAFRLEYTPTVEDHDALTRQYPRTTAAGRKAWLGRVWPLPAMLIGVAVLIGGINYFNKDIPWIYGMAAAFMAGGSCCGYYSAGSCRSSTGRGWRGNSRPHTKPQCGDARRTLSSPAKSSWEGRGISFGPGTANCGRVGPRCRASNGSRATCSSSWRAARYGGRRPAC